MNEAEQIAEYARCAARDLAKGIEGQLALAVARIQDDPTLRVKLGLTVTIAADGQTGMIRPEYTVRRAETSETRQLPGIPIGGQRGLFEGGDDDAD